MEKRRRRLKANRSSSTGLDQDFEAMVRQHTPYLKGVAFSLLHNKEDVEEVLQDSFVKAYKSLLSFSEEDRACLQARSWLSTIVWNTACTYLSRRRREISLDLLRETKHIDIKGRPYDWPELAVTRIEAETILAEALASLYPGQRGVIIRRMYEDKNYEETAKELGIGKRTAIVYAHRGYYSLRWKLETQGVDKDVLQSWDRVCEITLNSTVTKS